MHRSFHAADYSGMVNFCMLDPMGNDEPADLSIYDRLRRSDDEVALALVTGAHAREVLVYLGEAEYATLAPLARAAAGRVSADAPIVLIVPGIMGTQLGRDNRAPWPANLLWLDPADIIAGRLEELRLPEARPLRTLGAIPYSYLGLKLRLRAAGFDAQNFEYDWRHSIEDAGRELAAAVARLPPRPVLLVAHSMGGLVARAALADAACSARVQRVVTLGTPHLGALAPAQALRGVYPTVRRLAALDRQHDAEQLAGDVFGSFASLHDMLPAALLDPSGWPAAGLVPQPVQLRAAAARIARLAAVDQRHACIAGLGQRTATDFSRKQHELCYTITSDGDGTVPLASAAPRGAAARYCRCEHSELPRDAAVAREVIALLNGRDQDCALPSEPPAIARQPVTVTDSTLRSTYAVKIDWNALPPEERRRYLNQLNLAPPQYAAPG
jgi:pimeloyl-ACP methyl ester carboxylesterase